MFSRRVQQQARLLVTLLIQPFVRLGITPNSLTVVGLLLSVFTAAVIATGQLVAGGLLVLFAGIFDMFDGAVARVNNTATTFGAFFDSTLDRYAESIILLGLLVYALQRPDLREGVWPFAHEQIWMIILTFIAAVGSLMVSYTKARAEGLGLECKTGLLARPERVVILALGLLSGMSVWAVALLAVLAQVTALERIVSVRHSTQRMDQTRGDLPAGTLATRKDTSAENGHAPAAFETSEVIEPSALSVPTSVPPFNNGVHQE